MFVGEIKNLENDGILLPCNKIVWVVHFPSSSFYLNEAKISRNWHVKKFLSCQGENDSKWACIVVIQKWDIHASAQHTIWYGPTMQVMFWKHFEDELVMYDAHWKYDLMKFRYFISFIDLRKILCFFLCNFCYQNNIWTR